MMNQIKMFFILILIFSCSNEDQISKFESILGKDNSGTLTHLVSDFEKDFLKRNYPDLKIEKAYLKFLSELENDPNGNWKKTSKKSRELFNNSSLKLQVYGIADSVWIDKKLDSLSSKSSIPMIKVKWKYLGQNGKYNYGSSESSYDTSKNEDSIIAQRKKYIVINYYGKYREALKYVAEHNKFINKYLDMTQAAGSLHPSMLAYEMLIDDVDFSNYFIKRLIVTEIAYR
ncbi:hypothetical protein [uncultured Psychroserpens sp.]|uniref:hypothetical protein n=1 Tax=uncultured Psychroserpens sp. TaxID=255436 RepID=UPI0026189847|nr:hypothetical protein [uncultured Psychroserpens sp.]